MKFLDKMTSFVLRAFITVSAVISVIYLIGQLAKYIRRS